MKREIIFRGKRIDNGEWIEGSLIITKDRYKNIPETEHEIVIPLEYCAMTNFDPYRDKKKDVKRDFMFVKVIPSTIGQFTGFLDNNGNKIFENDILYCKKLRTNHWKGIYNWIDKISVVKYGKKSAGWTLKFYFRKDERFGTTKYYSLSGIQSMIIIGNIHDNPELLDEK